MSQARPRQRGARKCHWCFTSYMDTIPHVDLKVVRYITYQWEVCPETKRDHLQGYVEFFDAKRIGQVKTIIGECHLEPRRGSRTAARDYCHKLGSRRDFDREPFEAGIWRVDVNRKRKLVDILHAKISLNELIEESPEIYVRYHRGLHRLFSKRQKKLAKVFRNVEVEVLIGKTGTGKTRRATAGDDWFILPNSSDRLWFDGYDGEKTLILDDFYGGIKYSVLLRILDGHSYLAPVKGSHVWAQWTKVIITSNAEVPSWYKAGLTPALERRITAIIHL